MAEPYVFPGLPPHLIRAAEQLGLETDRDLVPRARRLEPIARGHQALAQVVEAKPEHKAELLAQAVRWRNVLEVALLAMDAAIDDVSGTVPIPPDEAG
jgi:hypothetical protein